MKQAENIRDRAIHGKPVAECMMREAIYDVLDYADKLNAHLQNKAGFQPFGSLQGFKGAAISFDKATSRWLLKGMGFAIQ